ncbi:hypothetical protein BJF79_09905 [Actinomadura sp. CNU-125]|nr:hypothetical protein BJF79_09905 [Actinomadura sp. CNU-125]
MRRAERDAQRTGQYAFQKFAALPPSAPESAFQGAMAGRAVEIERFKPQADRTELTIRAHEYADNSTGRLSHLEYCFDCTLLPPGGGKSTYRQVECPEDDQLSRWDLLY